MWLTVRSGSERGTTLQLDGECLVIGRDEDCDLVLSDPKVSRRHASLDRAADGSAVVRDLGSSNGTWVNGERIQSAALRGHEQIQVGETVLATSPQPPSTDPGRTVAGSAFLGGAVHGQSAVFRLLVERSVRRATVLAVSAVGVALVVGGVALFALLTRGESAVERVVAAAAPSTVFVEALQSGVRAESGSGWVLDGDRRLIVTNAHVVNGGTSFRIGTESNVYEARVVGVAPCEDLAVLAVPDAPPLQALPLGAQSSLALGETVVAVGYPENASREASLTSTTGVVSVVRSSYREAAPDVPRYPNVVQSDAAVNPGSSGGPLLDLRGRLVGVNSAERTVSPDGRPVQGQAYAIGVDRVKEVVAVLQTGRSVAWAGLGFDYAAAAELRRQGLPPGLLLTAPVPGTAAAAARLGVTPTVLEAVDGMPVSDSLASYCDAVAGRRSGELVSLSVFDRGARRERQIELRLE